MVFLAGCIYYKACRVTEVEENTATRLWLELGAWIIHVDVKQTAGSAVGDPECQTGVYFDAGRMATKRCADRAHSIRRRRPGWCLLHVLHKPLIFIGTNTEHPQAEHCNVHTG